MRQLDPIQAQQKYVEHSSLSDHFERLKTVYANNPQWYYKYAELQYFHKSRAFYYRNFFMAPVTEASMLTGI